MDATPVLSLRDVSIAFDGRTPVVKGVSCDVWAGATTCIVGESGSDDQTCSGADVIIGSEWSGVDYGFMGDIDDVVLWDCVMRGGVTVIR